MITNLLKQANVIIFSFFAFSLSAHEVNVSEASAIAKQFLYSGSKTSNKARAIMNISRVNQDDNNNLIYIFNVGDGDGFVIVSGDDCAHPILAYSNEGSFRTDSMPSNVQAVIESYKAEIKGARAKGAATLDEWKQPQRKENSTIDALIKTRWSQEFPYNMQCPILANKHCITGCVATAMAQIMNYWQWPVAGRGEHAINVYGDTVKSNFSKPFNWQKMRNTYELGGLYDDEEIDAISHLMIQCGIANNLAYSFNGTGGGTTGYPYVDYFDYDSTSISYRYLQDYTLDEWISIIKHEIDEKRPIHYGNDVHSFVCDGYDNADYAHFNFGWNGSFNGYYKLMATVAGFDFLNRSIQTMITGISPSTKKVEKNFCCKVMSPSFNIWSSAEIETGEIIEGNLYLEVYPTSYCSPARYIGIAALDANGNIGTVLYSRKAALNASYITSLNANISFQVINKGETPINYTLCPVIDFGNGWQKINVENTFALTVKPMIKGTTDMTFYYINDKIYKDKYNTINMGLKNDIQATFVGDIRLDIVKDGKIAFEKTIKNFAIGVTPMSFQIDSVIVSEIGTYDCHVYTKAEGTADFVEAKTSSAIKMTVTDKTDYVYLTDFAVDGFDKDYAWKAGETVPVKINISNPTASTVKGKLEICDYEKAYINSDCEISAGGTYSNTFNITIPSKESDDYYLWFESKLLTESQYGTVTTYLTFGEYDKRDPRINLHIINLKAAKLSDALNINDIKANNMYSAMKNKVYVPIDMAAAGGQYSSDMVMRLYDSAGNKISEANGYLSVSLYGGYCIMNVPETASGQCYLKIFATIGHREVAVLDTQGSPTNIPITVVKPIVHLMCDYANVNGEIYSFNQNNATMQRGVTTKLKYCVSNLYSTDYKGCLAVFVANQNGSIIPVSPDTPIEVKKNYEGKCYGTIDVTVPEDYRPGLTSETFFLQEKSENETVSYYLLSEDIGQTGKINLDLLAPTGIKDASKSAVSIYPNITTDYLYVSGLTASTNYRIYDVAGKLLKSSSTSNTIDVTSLNAGCYILRMATPGDSTMFRFIKK